MLNPSTLTVSHGHVLPLLVLMVMLSGGPGAVLSTVILITPQARPQLPLSAVMESQAGLAGPSL